MRTWSVSYGSEKFYNPAVRLHAIEIPWWRLAIANGVEWVLSVPLREVCCGWGHYVPLWFGREEYDGKKYFKHTLGGVAFHILNWAGGQAARAEKEIFSVGLTDEKLEAAGMETNAHHQAWLNSDED